MSPPPSPASSRSPTASGSAAASSALPGRPAPGLPVVDPEAAALSHQLSARIAQVIDEAGGWLPFDRYMAMALYEPGLGYYANGRPVFGAAGDFVTAPELTPLFGDAIARQLAVWFGEPAAAMALRAADDGPPMILEFGAGSGTLKEVAKTAVHAISDKQTDGKKSQQFYDGFESDGCHHAFVTLGRVKVAGAEKNGE